MGTRRMAAVRPDTKRSSHMVESSDLAVNETRDRSERDIMEGPVHPSPDPKDSRTSCAERLPE